MKYSNTKKNRKLKYSKNIGWESYLISWIISKFESRRSGLRSTMVDQRRRWRVYWWCVGNGGDSQWRLASRPRWAHGVLDGVIDNGARGGSVSDKHVGDAWNFTTLVWLLGEEARLASGLQWITSKGGADLRSACILADVLLSVSRWCSKNRVDGTWWWRAT